MESLRAERNSGSKGIGLLMREKKTAEANAFKEHMGRIGDEIDGLDGELRTVDADFEDAMLRIPNIPEPDVPVAEDESGNQVVKEWGDAAPSTSSRRPTGTWARSWTSSTLSGASRFRAAVFICCKGAGARLQRALINWFLDVHTDEARLHRRSIRPSWCGSRRMVGTGNLPKFGDNLYRDAEEDFWLIPTAEVPVTNLHRDEILERGHAAPLLRGLHPLLPPGEGVGGQGCTGHQAGPPVPEGGDGEVCRARPRAGRAGNADPRRRGVWPSGWGCPTAGSPSPPAISPLWPPSNIDIEAVGRRLPGVAGGQLVLALPGLPGPARQHPLPPGEGAKARNLSTPSTARGWRCPASSSPFWRTTSRPMARWSCQRCCGPIWAGWR